MSRIAQLEAAANWNGTKGAELYRQQAHVKNGNLQATMLLDAARHFRTHDRLRREAWMLSHTRAGRH